jgi:hypothetical protein
MNNELILLLDIHKRNKQYPFSTMTMHPDDIDKIRLNPSPIKQQPRVFRPGMLLDEAVREHANQVAEEIRASGAFDEQDLADRRSQEIRQLSQVVHSTQPVIDDDQAQAILQQLSMAIQTIDSMVDNDNDDEDGNDNIGNGNVMHATTMTSARPYPPVDQQGLVDDHDRPHAEYGHLGNVYAFVSVLKR